MDLTDTSVLRRLLESHDFRFSKSLGQNFLIRRWVPERILEVSGIDKRCGVLEIGPGVGVLTRELSRYAGKVCAVELDSKLLPILSETLADCPNASVVPGDVMKTDLAALTAEQFSGLSPVVCANLPYQITTPVISRLLESGLFGSLTLMVQKEVAQRICAAAGTADYGAFSLFVRYYGDARICFEVPPDCFQPRPKVTSAVIRIDTHPAPAGLQDPAMFFSLVRAAFGQRRKTLVNSLSPLLGGRLDKAAVGEVLAGCDLDPMIRGEKLDFEQYIKLSNQFSALLKQ